MDYERWDWDDTWPKLQIEALDCAIRLILSCSWKYEVTQMGNRGEVIWKMQGQVCH